MNELEHFIIEKIEHGVSVAFEEFMEWALYHPEWGYYTNSHQIGKDGDFYTAPYVSEVFGKCLANYFENYLKKNQINFPSLLELGAGKCLLAKDIVHTLTEKIKIGSLLIVEKNPPLVEIDQLNINYVKHYSDIDEIGDTDITGVIWCNEFFDSLPAARLKKHDGNFKKSFVTKKGSFLVEEWKNVLLSYVEDEFVNLYDRYIPENYAFEIPIHMKNIFEKIKKMLTTGIFLIVDYGNKANTLYSSQSAEGTIRSFKKHSVTANILKEPGLQDITYDINFDYLMYCAESTGFKRLFLKTQGEFLIENGILDEFSQNNDLKSLKRNNALKNLLLPGGMGEIFKVVAFSS